MQKSDALRAQAWLYFFIGALCLLLPWLIGDNVGKLLGSGLGVFVIGVGAFILRAATRTPAGEVFALNVQGAPASARRAYYSRLRRAGLAGCALLWVVEGGQLVYLETGGVTSMRLWGPIAWMYERAGFWAAILVVPALSGALLLLLPASERHVATQNSPE